MDIAIEQLKGLISFFEKYREDGLENAIISAKEIAIEMEPKFREKRVIRRKKQFDEIMDNEVLKSPEESFKTDYFLYIIDQAIISFQSRFEQFKIYQDIFGFLFSIVASAERSFSKLKLIKSYLRSTIYQQRLNGLALLSIEKRNFK